MSTKATRPADIMRDGVAEVALERVAGTATQVGAEHERWVEARLCNCTDLSHPVLERGIADSPWYWTRDVGGVEALRPFYPGVPHITRRHVLRATIAEGGA